MPNLTVTGLALGQRVTVYTYPVRATGRTCERIATSRLLDESGSLTIALPDSFSWRITEGWQYERMGVLPHPDHFDLQTCDMSDVFVVVTGQDGSTGQGGSPRLDLTTGGTYSWASWRDRVRSGFVTHYFDDGGASVYTNGREMFREFGIVTAHPLITGESSYSQPFSDPTWQRVWDMFNDGHTIDNHTRNHLNLGQVTDEAVARDQIVGATQDIVGRGFPTPRYFVYPQGSVGVWSSIVGEAITAEGVARSGNGYSDIPPTNRLVTGGTAFPVGVDDEAAYGWCAANNKWRHDMQHQVEPFQWDDDYQEVYGGSYEYVRHNLAWTITSGISYQVLPDTGWTPPTLTAQVIADGVVLGWDYDATDLQRSDDGGETYASIGTAPYTSPYLDTQAQGSVQYRTLIGGEWVYSEVVSLPASFLLASEYLRASIPYPVSGGAGSDSGAAGGGAIISRPASGSAGSDSGVKGAAIISRPASGGAGSTSGASGDATIIGFATFLLASEYLAAETGGAVYPVSGGAGSTSGASGDASRALPASGTAGSTSGASGIVTLVPAGVYPVSGGVGSDSGAGGVAYVVRPVSGAAGSTSGARGRYFSPELLRP